MTEYSSIKDRLAQVIYVVAGIAALVPTLVGLIRTPYGAYSYYMTAETDPMLRDAVSDITNGAALIAVGGLLYLVGWTIRWVLTGRDTSVFAYIFQR